MPTFNIQQALRKNLPTQFTGLEPDFAPITAGGMKTDDDVLKASQRLQAIFNYEVKAQRVNDEHDTAIRRRIRDMERELSRARTIEPSRINEDSDYRARQALLSVKNILRASALGRDTIQNTSWRQWRGSAIENQFILKHWLWDIDPDKEEWEEMVDLLYNGPDNPDQMAMQELEDAGYRRPVLGNLHNQIRSGEMLTHVLPQTVLSMAPAMVAGGAATIGAAAWGAPAAGVAAAGAVAGGIVGVGTEGFFSLGEAFRHTLALADTLDERGIDPTDREAFIEAMSDPEIANDTLKTSGKYAAGPGVVDALSFGVMRGPRYLARALTRGVHSRTARNVSRAVQYPGQLALQGVLEGAGDAGGQKWAYNRINYDEVAMEALVGGGMGVAFSALESGSNALLRRGEVKSDGRPGEPDPPIPPAATTDATRPAVVAPPVAEDSAAPTPSFQDESYENLTPERKEQFRELRESVREDHKGENLSEEEITKKTWDIVGREGRGVSPEALERANKYAEDVEEAVSGTPEDTESAPDDAESAPDDAASEGDAEIQAEADVEIDARDFVAEVEEVWKDVEETIAETDPSHAPDNFEPTESEEDSNEGAPTPNMPSRYSQRRANRQRKGITDGDESQSRNVDAKVSAKAIIDIKNSLKETRERTAEAAGVRSFLDTFNEITERLAKSYKERVPRNEAGAKKVVKYLETLLGNRGGIWVDARIVELRSKKGNSVLADATGLRRGEIRKRADDFGFVLIPFENLAEDILVNGKNSTLMEQIPDEDSKFRITHLTVNQAKLNKKNILEAAEARKHARGMERDKIEMVEFLVGNYVRAGMDPSSARRVARANAEILAAVAAVSDPGVLRRENWVRFLTADQPFIQTELFEGDTTPTRTYRKGEIQLEVERLVSILANHVNLRQGEKSIDSGIKTAKQRNRDQAHIDTMESAGVGAWGPAVQQDMDDLYLGGLDLDNIIRGDGGLKAVMKLTYGQIWRALMIGRATRAWNISSRERQQEFEKHWSRMHGPDVLPLVDYFNTATSEKERADRLKDVLHFFHGHLDRPLADQTLEHLITGDTETRDPQLPEVPVGDVSGVYSANNDPAGGTGADFTVLFATVDPVTIIHEFGHQVLTALYKASASGSLRKDVKADLETWLGMSMEHFAYEAVNNVDSTLYTDAHELFAEGLEHYMVTGKIAKNLPESLRLVFAAAARALANLYARFTNMYRHGANNKNATIFFDKLLAAAEAARREAQDAELYPEPTPHASDVSYDAEQHRRNLRELEFLRQNLDPDSAEDRESFDAMYDLALDMVRLGNQGLPTSRGDAWMNENFTRDEFNKDDWLIVMPNRAADPADVQESSLISVETRRKLHARYGADNVVDVDLMRDGKMEAAGYLVAGVAPGEALTQSGHHVAFTKNGWIRSDGKEITSVKNEAEPVFGSAAMSNNEYFALPNGVKFSVEQKQERTPAFVFKLKQRRSPPLHADDAAHKAELTSGPKYSEKRVEPFVQNILQLFDRIPDDLKEYAKTRPAGINKIARALATKHKRTLPQVAAVLAVFARNSSWDVAINGADRFLSMYRKTRDVSEIVHGYLDKKWLATHPTAYHPNGEIDEGAPTILQRPSPHVPEFVTMLVDVLATQDVKPAEGEEAITIGNALPQIPVLRSRFNMILDPTDAENVPVSMHAREAIALGHRKYVPRNNHEAAFIVKLAAERAGVSPNELDAILTAAWPKLKEALENNPRVQDEIAITINKKISREQKTTDTLDILPDPPSVGEVLGADVPRSPRKPKILRQQRGDTQATDESWKATYPVDPAQYPGIASFPPEFVVPDDFIEAVRDDPGLTYEDWYDNASGDPGWRMPNWVNPNDEVRKSSHPNLPWGQVKEMSDEVKAQLKIEKAEAAQVAEVSRKAKEQAQRTIEDMPLEELEGDNIDQLEAQFQAAMHEKRDAESRGDAKARMAATMKLVRLQAMRDQSAVALKRINHALKNYYEPLLDPEHVESLGITPEWGMRMRQVFGWYGALVGQVDYGAHFDNPKDTLLWFSRQGVPLKQNLLPWQRTTQVSRIQNLRVGEIYNLEKMYTSMLTQGRRDPRVPSELVEAINGFRPEVESNYAKESWIKVAHNWSSGVMDHLGALLRIPESLFVEMDGGEVGGTIWRNLFEPLNRAQDEELSLRNHYTGKITGILKAMRKEPDWEAPPLYESGTRSLSKEQIFMIAVNMGTNEGVATIIRTADPSFGLKTAADIDRAVSYLSSQDWKRVDQIWKIMGEMYKTMKNKDDTHFGVDHEIPANRKFTHQASDHVQDTTRPPLTNEGGWFQPIWEKDDGEYESQELTLELQRSTGIGTHSQDVIGGKAKTIHEYDTVFKAYEDQQGRELNLSYGALYYAISRNAHTLTHREAVAQVGFLLSEEGVATELRRVLSKPHVDYLRSWLVSVAGGAKTPNDGVERAARWLRLHASVAIIGFNVRSAGQQFLGFLSSAAQQGRGTHLISGMDQTIFGINKEFMEMVAKRGTEYDGKEASTIRQKNRYQQMLGKYYQEFLDQERDHASLYTFVKNMSPFMKNRYVTAHREFLDFEKSYEGVISKLKDARELTWILTRLGDMGVSVTVWSGVFKREMENGKTVDDAVMIADHAVRSSQGSGRLIDRSAALRGHELMRMGTMFLTALNAIHNLHVDAWNRWQNDKSWVNARKFVNAHLLLMATPALVMALAFDAPEEDEGFVEHLIWSYVGVNIDVLPWVREAMGIITGQRRSIEPTSLALLTDALKATRALGDSDSGDAAALNMLYLTIAVSGLAGAPAIFMRRIARATENYATDESDITKALGEATGIRGADANIKRLGE